MDLMRQYSKSMYFEGIIFILLGIIALVLPWVFTLAIELLLGVLFIIGGIAQGYRAFSSRETPRFWLPLVGAVFLLLAGILLLVFPLTGVLTLTLLLIVYFLVDGCAKMILSMQMHAKELWGWIFFLGALEVVLALLLWNGWPTTALWLIGTLVGISFLFQGIALLSISSSIRRSV